MWKFYFHEEVKTDPANSWPPPARVDAFGKPRDRSSNAAEAERFKESRRIEKALRHEHHGENVYAYAHIGTGQVVYSLTKVMDVGPSPQITTS